MIFVQQFLKFAKILMCDMQILVELFSKYYGSEPSVVSPIKGSASNRQYFRLANDEHSCVGVVGTDADENKAFITLDSHFKSADLPVPEVYAVSPDGMAYIQEDLGSTILYNMVADAVKSGSFAEVEDLLCKTISQLPRFQFEGGRGADWSVCYPEPSFSRKMVMFDLNYFKYCFLKPSGLEFNEVLLQDEFERLADDLLGGPDVQEYMEETFMYRDFQSRNVMVSDGNPYFIDFQGGRRGPIFYDLASFVWQPRAGFSDELRQKLVDAYVAAASEYMQIDRASFDSKLGIFVLFRLLQLLGAYGFRGLVENKAAFMVTIPLAMNLLREQLNQREWPYPYIVELLGRLVQMPKFQGITGGDGKLTVKVSSFSFHKGVPVDLSGNGGGYVFDCRSIHNPGRYEPYKKLTGRDEPVIKFLEEDGEVFQFLDHVYGVVDPHVETYSRRGFNSLMVSFGCTGGQHRSVYCAESLARHLRSKYPDINVVLSHREQNF